MKGVSRPVAAVGLALAQLRHDRMRTVLAVLGVTLAVLATTLLAGTGIGVVETGQEKFAEAGRDLWITGGPLRFAPGTIGGIRNSIFNSHQLAVQLTNREDVRTAAPLLFQTVYVSRDGGEYETLVAMGTPFDGGLSISAGRGWGADQHYADGNYTGPMTHEVLIDQRTAEIMGVGINDTLYIGGTIAAAEANEFRVVGISGTGAQFMGTPTVTLPLSELQEVTGKTGTDPATLVTIKLEDGVDVQRVEAELQTEYPEYDVRTNQEQLRATIERQAVVLAGGTSLIVMAVVAGLALTINTLLSMLYQQRQAYAALLALGASRTTLVMTTFVQAVVVGIVGGCVGVALTLPAARGLNVVANSVTGFEDVVRTPDAVLIGGLGVAVGMGVVGALVAGWQLARMAPLAELGE